MNKKVLAIIPARGGSKGVLRKNVRSVGGYPLISWSIAAAARSKLVTHFYVSTDDLEIASVSESFKANVLMRPSELAQDNTPMIPVLINVCRIAESIHGIFDYIVLLQPTAPMRNEYDIDSAINQLSISQTADSLISVYKVDDCHPSRMYTIENGTLNKFYSEPEGALRQDLDDVYHRNGALYICNRDLLMINNKLIGDKCIPYIMPKARSVNIDDESDLEIADFLMSKILPR